MGRQQRLHYNCCIRGQSQQTAMANKEWCARSQLVWLHHAIVHSFTGQWCWWSRCLRTDEQFHSNGSSRWYRLVFMKWKSPLFSISNCVSPTAIDGWDISPLNLGDAMRNAKVLDVTLQDQVYEKLATLVPRPSIYDPDFIAANQVSDSDWRRECWC